MFPISGDTFRSKKISLKSGVFSTLKNDRQSTTIITHFTTFSPSKNHHQTPVFLKYPGKTHQTDPIKKSLRTEGKMIQLADARRIIAAAEKKATEIGQPMNIAVADAGGNLIAHIRMDNAWLGSIDISIKKAWTSRAFDIATKDLATHSQSGGQFFGIHASNDGKVMIFAGGIPLKKDGKVVGAIGVSGGSGEQDHAVAEAGVAAF
jgi:uncharacterized protein GlcG (DUF336 family)